MYKAYKRLVNWHYLGKHLVILQNSRKTNRTSRLFREMSYVLHCKAFILSI